MLGWKTGLRAWKAGSIKQATPPACYVLLLEISIFGFTPLKSDFSNRACVSCRNKERTRDLQKLQMNVLPADSAVSFQTRHQICISIKYPKAGLVRTVTGRAGRQRAPSARGEGGHFSFSYVDPRKTCVVKVTEEGDDLCQSKMGHARAGRFVIREWH